MQIPPQFFDIFGALGFIYVTAFALWVFFRRESPPRWAVIVLFCIGILGLFVDSTIVYQFYLR